MTEASVGWRSIVQLSALFGISVAIGWLLLLLAKESRELRHRKRSVWTCRFCGGHVRKDGYTDTLCSYACQVEWESWVGSGRINVPPAEVDRPVISLVSREIAEEVSYVRVYGQQYLRRLPEPKWIVDRGVDYE